MENLKKIISQLGVDVCGIASVASYENAPRGFHPTDILSDAKSVIVYGKQFSRGTFLAKSNAPYTMFRNQLIQEINTLSMRLSLKIEEDGYIAAPIPFFRTL